MNELMRNLVELQSLEFEETIRPDVEQRISELRAKIPDPIISHYDRLGARGRKGVALVRHQTCAGCHMRVPLGMVMNLKHGKDIFLCDNCQRYLYLPEDDGRDLELVSPKKASRGGRKQPAHAL